MSRCLVGGVHIDALLTVGVVWGAPETGPFLPRDVRRRLALPPEAADGFGLVLLTENWNSVVYGGDPANEDAQYVETMEREWREDGAVKPQSHTFTQLPGLPRPETVLRLVSFYRYQTATDDWEEEWDPAWGPSELRPIPARAYVDALDAAVRRLLGGLEQHEIEALPAFAEMPWGLGEGDRDLFVRLA